VREGSAFHVISLIIVAIAFGTVIGWRLLRWRQQRRLARSRTQGRLGEARAQDWLRRNGYTIVEEQAERSAILVLGDREVPFTVRADFLVRRRGQTAVVEVKTGLAASIETSATRRQLLEYAALYDVDEIFLFDADAECLHRAHFPHLARQSNYGTRSWRLLVGGLVLLVGTVAAWRFAKG
jgi:Holliday junction resolvase-like predicted endonuclease